MAASSRATTRSDIGDFLGLTVETASLTFTKMKTIGLIELRQKNRVKLIALGQLESLGAGEDDSISTERLSTSPIKVGKTNRCPRRHPIRSRLVGKSKFVGFAPEC